MSEPTRFHAVSTKPEFYHKDSPVSPVIERIYDMFVDPVYYKPTIEDMEYAHLLRNGLRDPRFVPFWMDIVDVRFRFRRISSECVCLSLYLTVVINRGQHTTCVSYASTEFHKWWSMTRIRSAVEGIEIPSQSDFGVRLPKPLTINDYMMDDRANLARTILAVPQDHHVPFIDPPYHDYLRLKASNKNVSMPIAGFDLQKAEAQ